MQEDIRQANPAIEQSLTGRLEDVLRKPQKASSDWQTEASKLVSLAHINALDSTTADVEYLRLLALCQWAKKVGVADAKKKNIQAVRFRTAEPPQLGSLESTELIVAALELFANLRANWCNDYISNELVNPKIDKKGLGLMLSWAQKTAKSETEFIEIVLPKSIGSNLEENQIIILVKGIAHRVNFLKSTSANAAASDFSTAAQLICYRLKSCDSRKISTALEGLLLTLLQNIRLTHPSVVIHGEFLVAIQSIQDQLSETLHKKVVAKIATHQLAPTLSMLADFSEIGGIDSVSYLRLLLPSFRKAYANFDKSFADVCKENPALQSVKESPEHQEGVHLEDSAAALYARLLPSWIDYYKSQNEPEQLAVVNSDLLSAAKLNGIEFFGAAGEIVNFDPVTHRIKSGEPSTSSRVFIERPAVIFRRTNSSYRILLPAIVSLI